MLRAATFSSFLTFLISLASLALLLVLITPLLASARNGVGISVSPTHISPTIAVGDETSEAVTLINSSTDRVSVKSHPDFDNSGPAEAPSVWVEPGEVFLDPTRPVTVTVRVSVPPGTKPGQYQKFISFDVQPSAEGNVAIVSQISITLDINVIQPIEEANFYLPYLMDTGQPVVFSMSGRNRGNFPTRLSGTVKVAGLLGNTVELQAQSQIVAIGEEAALTAVWDDPPLMGFKKVTLTISTGVGSPVEHQSFLIILPWKFLLVFLSLLFTAGAGALLGRFFRLGEAPR
jgi:hypothetical protein